MKSGLILSTIASLALLGPAMASTDCPAFLNSEEGVPCIVASNDSNTVSTTATKPKAAAVNEGERKANADAWKQMVQFEK